MKKIYLDNNATTCLAKEVLEVMMMDLKGDPYNPSSMHTYGQKAKQLLISARKNMANYFSIGTKKVIFTSGGTEALNTCINGFLENTNKKKIISTEIEHSAIYNYLNYLKVKKNYEIVFLPTSERGPIDIKDLEKSIDDDTALIVLSYVNAETGIVYDIEKIAQIAKEKNVFFVVDAVAALGKIDIQLYEGISAICFSAHKIHGPKGVGAFLLIDSNSINTFSPLLIGGNQQFALRAGTENLAGILGFSKAIDLFSDKEVLNKNIEKMESLRDYFEKEMCAIEGVCVNGKGQRVCNISNLFFKGIEAYSLLVRLDMEGIMASYGSACNFNSNLSSRVLVCMKLGEERAKSSVRFSLSRYTTKSDINHAIKVIKKVVKNIKEQASK